MRNIIFVALAVGMATALTATSAQAENVVSGKPRIVKKSKSKSNLKTEAVFDGATVHGKYQVAGGAVAAVENEKTLNDIIGGRRNFKDRLKQDLGSVKNQTSEAK